MLDSPIALVLLGISAASAIASYTMGRRKRRQIPLASAPLTTLTDEALLAALAALQLEPDPPANNASIATQRRDPHAVQHPISATHSASRMREPNHSKSATGRTEDPELHRRITLLIVEEIARRRLLPSSAKR